jgi:hypothetical protein
MSALPQFCKLNAIHDPSGDHHGSATCVPAGSDTETSNKAPAVSGITPTFHRKTKASNGATTVP